MTAHRINRAAFERRMAAIVGECLPVGRVATTAQLDRALDALAALAAAYPEVLSEPYSPEAGRWSAPAPTTMGEALTRLTQALRAQRLS